MAKAKQQPSDTVTKSKTPSQMTVEKLQNDCYDLLVAMKEDGFTAKLHTTHKRETKEKLLPLLRALKSKLTRQGKKDGVDGWTAWFEENKADFGVSLRTADRWLDPARQRSSSSPTSTKLTASPINRKKFAFTLKFGRRGEIVGLALTPVPEKSQAMEKSEDPGKSKSKWLPSLKTMRKKSEEEKKKRIERAAEVRALQVAAGAVPEVLRRSQPQCSCSNTSIFRRATPASESCAPERWSRKYSTATRKCRVWIGRCWTSSHRSGRSTTGRSMNLPAFGTHGWRPQRQPRRG